MCITMTWTSQSFEILNTTLEFLYLFLIYSVIINSLIILAGFFWHWHLVCVSYSVMSYVDSKMSLVKCGDFKPVGMAVHPSFLLAFNSLLLTDIYVYLVVDSCIIFSSFKLNFAKQINVLQKKMRIILIMQA